MYEITSAECNVHDKISKHKLKEEVLQYAKQYDMEILNQSVLH